MTNATVRRNSLRFIATVLLAAGFLLVARPAAAATLIISGVVQDSSGVTLDGVTVKLTGGAQATVTTNVQGAYSFTVASGGSYSVSAAGLCASFQPGVVNLNALTTGTTVDFVGSGGQCSANTSSGATSGPLSISGQVTSAGQAIPGAKVTLSGGTSAFRYTDEAGNYSFSVSAGSYSVKVTGGCTSYSPDIVNLNGLKASKVQNFTGSGNCPVAPLALCPEFDLQFLGTSEPPACNNVSTPDCAFDRSDTWDGVVVIDFAIGATSDCRFGKWSGLLTSTDVANYLNELTVFTLYFFGCPATGTVTAPLADGLIPPALQGHSFTTADLAALSQDYLAAIEQSLADNGSPALTTAQVNAINAQLAAIAARVPNVTNSNSLTFSTCTP